ncbi:putative membrane protein [Anaerobacterium chartisolvens]|uniref:Putative membrane protein n=1 Tax=Anaerobacterium chartisolvens TaxID=1297424 RepID=A0A369B7X1_9FIRM|nr:putative ABC transporter permease [Anaerobacterium chartisolvens]RCX17620.1 putative membrane protein [Anaerobacterium chartisolvens]
MADFRDVFFYFVFYALVGWCIETIYVSILEKRFVNRGFLNGPFCPVYGFGFLIVIAMLTPIKQNLPVLFIGSIVLTSALEYLTGFALEKIFNHTWWDYSHKAFNLKGRICLSNSLIWGILSVVTLHFLHPQIKRLIGLIDPRYHIIIIASLSAYFAADAAFSVISVVGLNLKLKQLHYISSDIKESLKRLKESTSEKTAELEAAVLELKSRYEELLDRRNISHSRLINAFPSLKSRRFGSMLEEIKDSLASKREKLRHSIKSRIGR